MLVAIFPPIKKRPSDIQILYFPKVVFFIIYFANMFLIYLKIVLLKSL